MLPKVPRRPCLFLLALPLTADPTGRFGLLLGVTVPEGTFTETVRPGGTAGLAAYFNLARPMEMRVRIESTLHGTRTIHTVPWAPSARATSTGWELAFDLMPRLRTGPEGSLRAIFGFGLHTVRQTTEYPTGIGYGTETVSEQDNMPLPTLTAGLQIQVGARTTLEGRYTFTPASGGNGQLPNRYNHFLTGVVVRF